MNKLLARAALAACLVGMSAAPTFADTAMTSSTAMPANMPTVMCRPAATGEKPSAMMGATGIVCKQIDMKKLMAIKAKLMGMPGGTPVWEQMLQMLPVGNGAGS